MAVLTIAALKTKIDTYIYANGVGAITAVRTNELMQDVVDTLNSLSAGGTIYTIDGMLGGNRIIDADSNSITFDNVLNFIANATNIELNGSLKIVDGSEGNNKVLTSDASGNATWQTPSGGGGGGSFPDPIITSVLPVEVIELVAIDIEITGSYFKPTSVVTVEDATVNTITVNSGESITVNITPSSTLGTKDVTVDNGGSSSTTEVDAIEVLETPFSATCSLNLDGTNEQITVPNADLSSYLNGATATTMSFVFKPSAGQTDFLLISNGNTDRGIFIYWLAGTLGFIYNKDGTANNETVTISDSGILWDDWNMLTISIQTSTGYSWLWLNGALQTKTSNTLGAGDSIHTNTHDYTIGGGGAAGFSNFEGLINQFYVVNRVITGTEASDLYNSGQPLDPEDYLGPDCVYMMNASDAVFGGVNFTIEDTTHSITATSVNMEAVDKVCDDSPYVEEWTAPRTACNYDLEFGLVNDQSAKLQVLFDRAKSGDVIEICGGIILVENPVIIDKAVTIIHHGAHYKTTTNSPIFQFAADGITIRGFAIFEGSDNSGHTSQFGIDVGNNGNFKIGGTVFRRNYKGINVGSTLMGLEYLASQVNRCEFESNTYGFFGASGAEYINISDCTANLNNTAFEIGGGNNNINACTIYKGVNGIIVRGAGLNSAHGIINGCQINHQTGMALFFDSFNLGHTVSNNHIYQGNIYLKDCEGVNISGGIIDAGAIYFENAVGTRFHGVTKDATYANTVDKSYNGAPASTIIEYNNYNIDGTVYTL